MVNKIVRYQDQQGFSIEYPNNWKGRKENDLVFIYAPINEGDDFRSNIIVKIDDLETDVNLLDYSKLSLLQIMKQTDDKPSVGLLKDLKIANKNGKLITYYMQLNSRSLKICSAWFIHNAKAYIITYTSTPEKFNDNLKIALRIFDSLELT